MKKLIVLLALLPSMLFATTITERRVNDFARIEISSPSYPPGARPPYGQEINSATLFLDLKAGYSTVEISYGTRLNPGCFYTSEEGKIVYSRKNKEFSIIPVKKEAIDIEYIQGGREGFNVDEDGKFFIPLREPMGPVCMAIGEHSRTAVANFNLKTDATVEIKLGQVSPYGNVSVTLK